jgi:hypothetical protein
MSTLGLLSYYSAPVTLSSPVTFSRVLRFTWCHLLVAFPLRLVVTHPAPTIFQYYLLELSILRISAWAVNGSSSAA